MLKTTQGYKIKPYQAKPNNTTTATKKKNNLDINTFVGKRNGGVVAILFGSSVVFRCWLENER